MTKLTQDQFNNFFKYYDDKPHQKESIAKLYSELPKELLLEDSEWVRLFRNKKEETPPTLLDVEYFSQRDNYRDAGRTCFSSSCAMLLKYLLPKTIKTDDDYIREVFRRGDTTSSWIQLTTLRHFGLECEFVQDFNNEGMKKLIDSGIPVPCGILHHGPGSAPSGGGHWITVIGYDDNGWIVNDPWGTLHHPSGQYVSTNGDRVHYSYEMLNARWTVSNSSDGWAIIAKKKTETTPEPEQQELVSKEDLAYIWNCASSLIKDHEVEEMNSCLYTFDITTPQRIRHFLSQTAHESGGGRYMEELASGWDYEYRSDLGRN